VSKEHQEILSIADIDALNLLGVGDKHLRSRRSSSI
jgi:hypothetical protein